MRAVLGVRVYRRLLSVYALNEAAWSIGLLAVSLLVYRRTGSAWASTAFFLASQFAPAFVSPSLVARLERLVAGRALAGLYATQGAIFALLAASPSHFALVPLLALSLAAGIFGLAARPLARATVTSVLVPAGLLREGNAATNVAFSVCILLGPIVGGAIVAAAGTAVALLVVAGMFVAAALVAATIGGLRSSASGSWDARARVRTAIAATGREALIRKLLLFQAVALVFLSMSVPVEVVFAQHSLHVGAGGYGALLSAWGLGAIVGSAVYARWRALPGWLLIGLSTMAVGVGFVVMAAAPSLWVALIGSAVGGVGNGIEPVVERTALQERVEQRWLALTLSLNESMFQAMPGLGFVLGGGIAALAGARTALAVGGIGAIVIGALAPAVLRSGWGSQRPPGEDGVEPTPSGPRRPVEDHRVAERG
jgi:MFS family permease